MWLLIPFVVVILAVLLVAGAVVAVLATVGLIIAAAVHAIPFFILGLGIWIIAKALGGSRRDRRGPRYDYRHSWTDQRPASGESGLPQRVAVQPGTVAAQSATVAASEPSQRRDLPIDVQVKVDQIQRKADLLLGYADRFPPFSQDLHIVRQTTSEYLPRTVAAYLAVPGVGDPLLGASSKTALQELQSQLNLLDSKLDEIAHDLQQHDLDQLLANRRFLEERFGLRERSSRTEPVPEQAGAA
jgi:hypothetical protein